MIHETITPEALADPDNLTECECGNTTHYEYSASTDSGEVSCPVCMMSWQGQQIEAMKILVYELSPKSREETARMINEKYAKIMGVDMEYMESMEYDYSKVNEEEGG
jgi:uncharacterized Zn finger protein (UPF0148 family)